MGKEANLRSSIFNSAREASLAKTNERESTPDIQQDGDFANTPFYGGQAFEREEPPKDHMRRYWRQYETTPLVREPINTFASQVVEPGYWVDDGGVLSDEEYNKLIKWLKKCGVHSKEPDKDLHHILKQAIVQREVRGTALLKKVYAKEDNERLYGLVLLNPETVRPNSRPGKPLLLLPDDEPEDFNVEGDFPKTDDGDTAAYTQYTTKSGFGSVNPKNEDVNNFTIDDVLKLVRDPDVNEAWGTSRLEAVSDTIEGIKQKMQDNNEAIASKAYPLWLFMFGSEEQPWDRDDINAFMNAHDMENFHPGLKQGVRGDVSIETISGEVADIVDYLEFDVDYILSAMPMPKYILGGFEQNINQFVSRTQERSVNRQIKEARRELEAELTEVVQQKAEEMFDVGEDDKDDITFKIGVPGEEGQNQDPNENTINYNGVGNQNQDQQDGQDQQGPTHSRRNSWGYGGPADGANGVPDDPDSSSEDQNPDAESATNTVWDVDLDNVEELADPRMVSSSDVQSDMTNLIEQVFMNFRERTMESVRREYSDAPFAASMAFEGIANTQLNRTMQDADFERSTTVLMNETVERTLSTLEQNNQSVTLDTNFGPTHRQNVRRYAGDVRDSARNAMQELAQRMDQQLSRAANNGETLEDALQRIENTYSPAQLKQRARIIAQMEIQSAIESTKLTEFEQSDDVAGVKVVNVCTDSTTDLCKDLAGCGPRNGAVASFEASESLSEQWESQTAAQNKMSGFDPLPPVPPFHFGCRSELVPLSADELTDAEQDRPVSDFDELADKYGFDEDDL